MQTQLDINRICGSAFSRRINQTGDNNTVVGESALENNTTASNNTAIGFSGAKHNWTSNTLLVLCVRC